MRKGIRQEVTGIVVNDKISIERNELRKFRALIHQVSQTGTEGKVWREEKNLENSMRGYANFVMMVKPELGKKFANELDKIFGVRIQPNKKEKTDAIMPPIIQSKPESPSTENDGKPWWEVI